MADVTRALLNIDIESLGHEDFLLLSRTLQARKNLLTTEINDKYLKLHTLVKD
ncbi:hypothetical protein [Bacteroides eggerthii]|uniref:hypothetical protein n=1 Tax=Bacteroides eggerthii TaxID=28111 RepID=UPI00189E0ED8|nr:hypothetical protein [Bacteroides eggerthii]